MALTFDAGDYEQIRKAIDADLTADVLPDELIGLDIYQGEAIEQVNNALIALTDQQRTDNAATIKRAAILLTASLLATKIKVVTSEVLEGDRFTFQNKDLNKLKSDLESAAFGIIGRLLNALLAIPTPADGSFAYGLFDTVKANPK